MNARPNRFSLLNRFDAMNSSIPIHIEIGQLTPSRTLEKTGYLLSLSESGSDNRWMVTDSVKHRGHELGFGN